MLKIRLFASIAALMVATTTFSCAQAAERYCMDKRAYDNAVTVTIRLAPLIASVLGCLGNDQDALGPLSDGTEISSRSVRLRDHIDPAASVSRRQIDFRQDIQRPRCTCRLHHRTVRDRVHREIIYEVVADIRVHDRLRLSGLLGDPDDLRRGCPRPCRPGRTAQLPVVKKTHRKAARDFGLSCLVAS